MQKQKRILRVFAAWAAAGILAAVIVWFRIPCWINQLTGLDCPSCGTTRMLSALIGGNFQLAIQHNAFMLVAIPFGLLLAAAGSFEYIQTGKLFQTRAAKAALLLLILSAVIFMIGRNIS